VDNAIPQIAELIFKQSKASKSITLNFKASSKTFLSNIPLSPSAWKRYATLGTAAKVEAFQKHGSIPLPVFLNYFLIRPYESPKYATYIYRLKRLELVST
jgi:hypothetical protein